MTDLPPGGDDDGEAQREPAGPPAATPPPPPAAAPPPPPAPPPPASPAPAAPPGPPAPAPPPGSAPSSSGAAPPPPSYPGAAPPAPPVGYGQPAGYAYGGTEPVDEQGRPLAGWWQRFGAILIDGLILGIPRSLLTAAFVNHVNNSSVYTTGHVVAAAIVIGIVFTVIDIAYFALLDGSQRGQTVGQMALGIAVRDDATGGPIGAQRAGLRILVLIPGFILNWIPVVGLLAGLYTIVAGLSPLWDSRRQGFHDKAAHTFVIKVR